MKKRCVWLMVASVRNIAAVGSSPSQPWFMINLDLFHLEQISSKKSDWVNLPGHSFLSELVTICHQFLGGGGSNDCALGTIKNLSGRPALERNAPTIYGS